MRTLAPITEPSRSHAQASALPQTHRTFFETGFHRNHPEKKPPGANEPETSPEPEVSLQ